MSTAYPNGILKDSSDDSFCEAVVVNDETGKCTRFRTIQQANNWSASKNKKLTARGLAARYSVYPPHEIPSWAK